MCTWNPVSPELRKKNRKSNQLNYHYTWDLDDGRPGFVRHTKRDRLRLFVDSDGDGLFTSEDELVGRARIRKKYQNLGQGELLNPDSYGIITAFNSLSTNISDTHNGLSSDAGLIFTLPNDTTAAIFKEVFLPTDYL